MSAQPSDTGTGKWTETRYMRVRKEGPVLHCVFTDCPHLDLEIAKHCVQQRLAISAGISYPCLIDMRDLKSVSTEAREYMAAQGATGVKAGALLIGSQVTKMIANIFLLINKPKVPTKMFTDEKAAREWLKKYS